MIINILDKLYPVGSYYISASSISPANAIGGSWTSLDEGTFLCAAGNTIAANSGGGLTR